MYGRKDYNRSSAEKELEALFKKYAKGNGLNGLTKDQLKDAFYQLGTSMPYKHAEEAFKVADKDNDRHIKKDDEYKSLVEYAINNGFWGSL